MIMENKACGDSEESSVTLKSKFEHIPYRDKKIKETRERQTLLSTVPLIQIG